MKTFFLRRLAGAALLLLLTGSAPGAPAKPVPGKPDSAAAAALKKVTDRYALTKARIATLVDQRLSPSPLPASLPNPFYRPLTLPPADATPAANPDVAVPSAPDSSDADTLAKFAAALKVSGVVILNGQPHLTINAVLCKVGDVIPTGGKDHPVYIQVLRITPDEVTLGLNQDEQTVRLKK